MKFKPAMDDFVITTYNSIPPYRTGHPWGKNKIYRRGNYKMR